MQSWVDLAEKQGYPVVIQEAAAEIANLEAKRQRPATTRFSRNRRDAVGR